MIHTQHSFLAPQYYSSGLDSVMFEEMDPAISTAGEVLPNSAGANYGNVPDGEIIRIAFETPQEAQGKPHHLIYLY